MTVPKLRFKGFEGDWSIKSLSELANLTSSKRVHLADYVPDGIPFFRGKEITELKSGVFPSDILYISHSQFNEFKEKYGVPKNNEILITAVGTLANTYLVNTNYDFYFKDGNLIWLKDIKADPKFMMILLDAKKNDVLASAIGSTQKALTIANLNKLIFNFPCNLEQTKIASFLSVVDEKISQLTQKHELLSQYKQGMMQKLFSQQIRFKADDGSEFGEWEKTALNTLCSRSYQGINTVADKVEYQQSGYPILQAKHITSEKLDLVDVRYLSDLDYEKYKEKYIPKVNDILFSNIGTIGKVVLVGTENPFFIAWNIFLITPKETLITPLYLTSYLRWLTALNYFDNLQTGNATKFINKTDLLATVINLPCLEEQTKIANFLSSIDQKVDVVAQQIEQAKQWKKGLLQQMFV